MDVVDGRAGDMNLNRMFGRKSALGCHTLILTEENDILPFVLLSGVNRVFFAPGIYPLADLGGVHQRIELRATVGKVDVLDTALQRIVLCSCCFATCYCIIGTLEAFHICSNRKNSKSPKTKSIHKSFKQLCLFCLNCPICQNRDN